jgi:hypothetical protein
MRRPGNSEFRAVLGLPSEEGKKVIEYIEERVSAKKGQLQAQGLGHLAAEVLGRANSDRLLRYVRHRSRSRRRPPRRTSARYKSQVRAARRSRSGEFRQHCMPQVWWEGEARDRHYGHVRRVSGTSSDTRPLTTIKACSTKRRSGTGSWIGTWGHRARNTASSLREVLHEGAPGSRHVRSTGPSRTSHQRMVIKDGARCRSRRQHHRPDDMINTGPIRWALHITSPIQRTSTGAMRG